MTKKEVNLNPDSNISKKIKVNGVHDHYSKQTEL